MKYPPMKAWMVRYTSLRGTPCFNTLSRSTSTNSCGTLGRKVVLKPAISGRLRAASRKVPRFLAGNRGWRKTEGNGRGQSAQFPVQVRFDGLELFRAALALIPRFEGHEEERV